MQPYSIQNDNAARSEASLRQNVLIATLLPVPAWALVCVSLLLFRWGLLAAIPLVVLCHWIGIARLRRTLAMDLDRQKAYLSAERGEQENRIQLIEREKNQIFLTAYLRGGYHLEPEEAVQSRLEDLGLPAETGLYCLIILRADGLAPSPSQATAFAGALGYSLDAQARCFPTEDGALLWFQAPPDQSVVERHIQNACANSFGQLTAQISQADWVENCALPSLYDKTHREGGRANQEDSEALFMMLSEQMTARNAEAAAQTILALIDPGMQRDQFYARYAEIALRLLGAGQDAAESDALLRSFRLSRQEGIEALLAVLARVCSEDELGGGGLTGGNSLTEQIVAYVQGNYSNMALNVNTIAEHFDKHPVYISSLFREQMDVRLSEYISRTRITSAKELLGESNDSQAQIATQVGFSDQNALIRVFKKLEGITPGEYRRIHYSNMH